MPLKISTRFSRIWNHNLLQNKHMNIPTEFCNFPTDNCMINQNNWIMNHLKSILFACGSLFVSSNTLSHSILLKTTNSKRYKFWIGENLWFKAFGKEKKLWQGQKAVLRLFMKIFWAILADCYPKSAFLMNSPTFISHKEWDNRKRKGGGERALLVAST